MNLASLLGVAGPVACLALLFWGLNWLHRLTPPPAPPQAPQARVSEAEWPLVPFQLIGGLAALLWAAIGLAVFLSPLLILAWLVVR